MSYLVKSRKWDLGKVNVRRPYHYLIEIERLFPKDPLLNYLVKGYGSKKSCCRRIPQERGSICLPGMCKFGASCKYHHPRQRGESSILVMPNIHGYPLRPNEKECSHYMETGQCKFGMTCKFHHSQPADAQVPASAVAPLPLPEAVLPPTTYPALQSPSVDSAELHGMIAGNWPVVRPTLLPGSYFPGTYGPMLFPPGMVPMPDWTPYPDSASPVPSKLLSLQLDQIQFIVVHNYLLLHLPTLDHICLLLLLLVLQAAPRMNLHFHKGLDSLNVIIT